MTLPIAVPVPFTQEGATTYLNQKGWIQEDGTLYNLHPYLNCHQNFCLLDGQFSPEELYAISVYCHYKGWN